MSGQQQFQPAPSPAQQPHGRANRVYTLVQLLSVELLNMPRSTFFHLRAKGELPWVQEIRPRAGRVARFKAEPINRYLDGLWNQPRSFGSHVRQSGSAQQASSRP